MHIRRIFDVSEETCSTAFETVVHSKGNFLAIAVEFALECPVNAVLVVIGTDRQGNARNVGNQLQVLLLERIAFVYGVRKNNHLTNSADLVRILG